MGQAVNSQVCGGDKGIWGLGHSKCIPNVLWPVRVVHGQSGPVMTRYCRLTRLVTILVTGPSANVIVQVVQSCIQQ